MEEITLKQFYRSFKSFDKILLGVQLLLLVMGFVLIISKANILFSILFLCSLICAALLYLMEFKASDSVKALIRLLIYSAVLCCMVLSFYSSSFLGPNSFQKDLGIGLACMVVYAGFLCSAAMNSWTIWLTINHPLLSLNDTTIQWREVKSRRYNVVDTNQIKRIFVLENVNNDVNLELISREKVCFSLVCFSQDDKDEIRKHAVEGQTLSFLQYD